MTQDPDTRSAAPAAASSQEFEAQEALDAEIARSAASRREDGDSGDASDGSGVEQQQRLLLHMPVDIRNLSLAIIAVLACAFALRWAKDVVIPILLGVMISYALTPLVERLERRRVPRAAGAGVVLLAILGLLGWGVYALGDDAAAFVETLPQVAQEVREKMAGQKTTPGGDTLAKMQQAAAELERAATESSPGNSAAAGGRPAPPVVVMARPRLDIRDYLLTGTLGLAAFLGQATIVVFIAFFLLASGSTFRRKMVKLAGPKLSTKKITVQALDEIGAQIQRYLLVQLATSAIVGVATGLAFLAIGLNNSAIWGVVAGVTNLIPYIGAVLVGGASTLVGFIQFGSIDMGLLVGASSFVVHMLVGNLLTPWWMGRTSRMNPFVVFVAVLLFGWLWGVWGLLLGVPIVVAVKTVCDRVDELKPIGELLGA